MSESNGHCVTIVGTGSYLPAQVVTNEDISNRVDTSDEWIQQRTGIKTRRYVDFDNEGSGDYEGESKFGLLAGGDFFANPNVFFTTEFHLFDENAFYFSAGYRF